MDGVPPRRWLDGVSSQRLRRFPPPGVGVAPTPSAASALSVRGVSAQPPPKWLGVSPLSVLGVSSQRFLFPGVRAPGVTPPGVASHTLELGVTPGVSPPFLPGVSSQRLADGVLCKIGVNQHVPPAPLLLHPPPPHTSAWSQDDFLAGASPSAADV